MERLDPKSIENILALTPLQEGMLFHYLQDPQSQLYFEQLSLEIWGEIDVRYFEKAWNTVIETNEMLRAVFRWEKLENPSQIILKEHTCKVIFYDLSDKDCSQRKTTLEEIKNKDRRETFDLHQVPFRVILCKIDEAKYEMVISYHHILYDGWSNGIILKEFFKVYHKLCHGGQVIKRPVKPPFKEFIKWIQSQDRNKQQQFWREYLASFETPTELPIKRRLEKTTKAEDYSIILEEDIKDKLDVFVKNNRVTLASIFYTAWGILLQKYCDSEDVIFGTTVSGRSAGVKGIEDMVGLFINTIPLRVQSAPCVKMIDILSAVENVLQVREEFESTPLPDIRSCSTVGGSESLFDTIVAIENYPLDSRLLPEDSLLSVNSYSIAEMTHYDLTVGIMLFNEIEIKFSYNRGFFDKETVKNLAGHFKGIVQNIIENPEAVLSQLEIISIEEKNRILYEFNDTEAEYPKDKTIHQLFAEQVERTPDSVAVVGGMQYAVGSRKKEGQATLTYRELNRESNQLAQLLKGKGVTPDHIAAIMLERSIDMIIGILGILKAGGAYMPIDPEYPQKRIDYMLKDSGAKLLVTTRNKEGEKVGRWGGEIFYIEESLCSSYPLTFLPSYLQNSSNPATGHWQPTTSLTYIIYTSGTTGKPKGVMVEHRSVVNLIRNQDKYFNINESDRILQFSSICFDASVEQIFIAFSSGAVLVLIDKNTLLDVEKFDKFVFRHQVSHIHAVPSFLNGIHLKNAFQLKRVIAGGDVCPMSLAEKWNASFDFYNEYGPTETTITSMEILIKDTNEFLFRLPVGKPISNTTIYLLNGWMKPVPLGVMGELYIGGAGVARGYLNRPELTAEKFISLSPLTPHPSPFYRTGDLARFLSDGNIEFLGRIDHQVKIRGFRVELGEIESRLLNYPGIKGVVVLAREEEGGDRYICAYIVSDREYRISELRESMSKELPDYMIPSYFVRLEKIPLTPNGKVDRKALPKPELKVGENYTAPRNKVEKNLVDMWAEILARDALHSSQLQESIGIDDNFFLLGGHSLKATILVSRIEKAFNVKIPLSEIFKTPRIRELSGYMKEAASRKYEQIELAEKKEYYALSSAQKRLYFLQQMDKDGTAYNISAAWILEGIINKPVLEQSMRGLIRRHESLRTSIEAIEEEPVQRIHEHVEFQVENYKIQNTKYKQIPNHKLQFPNKEAPFGGCGAPSLLDAFGDDTSLTQDTDKIIKEFVRTFDLSQAPLLRVGLIKIEKDRHIFLADMHHIISDGMSTQVLVQDFSALYGGKGKELPEIKLRYKDYAEWQNRERVSKKIPEQGEYWKKEYVGEIPVLELPTDYARPAVQGFEGNSINFEINSETFGALKTLALEAGATLYIVLLALYTILLSKLSSQEDIVIGSPVAGRRHADLEKVIGMVVNTLALRNYPSGEKGVMDFLGEVKEIALKGFENQEYQYEDLVEQISVNRDVGRNPLFDTMFVLQNTGSQEIEIPGLKLVPYEYENKTAKFDLTLTVVEVEEKLLFTFEYSTKLFKRETVERFIDYFKNIVRSIVENRNRRISDLEILTEKEKNRILYEFNDTEAEYPKDKTIHQLFEEQVEQTPDRIALVGAALGGGPAPGQYQITYRELNNRSNRLTHVLQTKGVGPDTIVGVMLERSIDMIIGILGILKAGGAYLPVDPGYPSARINYILKNSETRWLVTQRNFEEKIEDEYKVIHVEALYLFHKGYTTQSEQWEKGSQSNHLAYVIYTSGSTGNPKGVAIEHRSVVNLVWGLNELYPFADSDVYLLKTSYLFDVSVSELFGWFPGGGKLALLEKGGEKDPQAIVKAIESFGVTHINFVPSQFNVFVDGLNLQNIKRISGLKYIFLAGEALLPGLVNKFKVLNLGVHVENLYGPTEAAVYASVYSLAQWEGRGPVSIGKPFQNTKLYVVDKYGVLQPCGVPGELCISGVGLARGYLKQEELSAQKFIKNPFNTDSGTERTYERLYRTGDWARWQPDGSIEFLGRIDQQVKLRGYRIELGEIENRLLKYEGIKEAVVLLHEEEGGDKYLCAYIVSDREYRISELRESMSKELPDYMIPSYFVRLEKIPLTPNGKVDRKALPKPELKVGENYTAPRNKVEKKLVELWAEILGRDALHMSQLHRSIGIGDNFFLLGGHSLKATILVSKIHKVFDVIVPLTEIFKTPRIRELSLYIKESASRKYEQIELAEKKEYYALSSAQKRLYFLQQMDKNGAAYNISGGWILEGIINKPLLEQSIRGLIRRHESLRTSIEVIEEEPVQRIHEHVEFEIEYKDLATEDTEVKNHHSSFMNTPNHFIRAFDLSKAPLLRVGLLKLEEEKHLFLVDMHHIISDGMSTQVLVQDFSDLFGGKGKELPEIKLQYKDYAEWQNRERVSKKILEQGEYWKKEYEGEIPVLKLPTDYARPTVQGFEGKSINFEINSETSGALKALALETVTTLYIVLLALYNIFLAKLSSQEDIVIGSPVAGRKHADLEKIIGMFVNTLPFRSYPSGEKGFMDFLGEVKEIALKGFENQEYQYEDLVEKIPVNRDLGRNPLFDTMFVLQNTGSQEIEIPGLKFVPYEYEDKTSKFDLTLTVVEVEGKLLFTFEYSTKLFKRETLERFSVYFKNIVRSIVENKELRISGLEILTEEERNRILFEFNDSEVEYPKDKTIRRLFAEQVEQTPDRIALVGAEGEAKKRRSEEEEKGRESVGHISNAFGVMHLTYKELNEQSDRLAYSLIEKGALADNIVGLMVERSIEMIVGILGILKSGGAYLPIAPDYPRERIDYMLNDCDAKLLVLKEDGMNGKYKEERNSVEIVFVDASSFSDFPASSRPRILASDSANLAYIIYTSGSTGKPKGVMVQRGGFLNLLRWYIEAFAIREEDNNLLIAPISFDLSQKNLFSPFLSGGRLTLASPGIPDYQELTEIIHKEHITMINCAPSVFYPLIDSDDNAYFNRLHSLRAIILGGEPIRSDKLLPWVNSGSFHCEIINTYGPTECTDIALYYRIPLETFLMQKVIPIGKPIPNAKVYILDRYLKVLPVRIPGELCIGGMGLSKGYYNNIPLTQEKFVDTPHLPGEKVYFTGDLARWLADGNIEFLGRIDQQVKIRGFRIELGEVESELSKHEEIKEAVVTSRQSETGDSYLCAYIVPRTKQQLSVSGLREYLGRQLPDYMVPAYFVYLDRIPLTPSGKVDRRALPKPEFKAGDNYTAPRNEIERELVELWSEVLGRDALHASQLQTSLGIDDNFFQLGGHSLKATILVSRIERAFNIKIPLTEIFKTPRIRELSGYIKEAAAKKYEQIELAEKKEYYVLSSAQKRLYFLQQMDKEGTAYNIPSIMILEGIVDKEKLGQSILGLIRRHESLRTSIEVIEEKPFQRIHEDVEFAIEHYDLSGDNEIENSKFKIQNYFVRPFDLSQAPLLRVGLIKIEKNRHILLVDMHHITSDGMSTQVLVQDFSALYAEKELPEIKFQYKDYAEWQNREKVSRKILEQGEYWKKEYEGEIPVLELPTNYARPAVQTFEGNRINFEIKSETAGALKALALEAGATLYIVVLALYTILLSKLSSQEDIVIGSPVAGRRHADLEKVIGMFVNTLALRNYPSGEKRVMDFLGEVKEIALKGFENQEYQYEDLVEQIPVNRDIGRNPLFDTMFVLQNTGSQEIEIPGLKLVPYEYENKTSKFDLTLTVVEVEEKLSFTFEYSTKLFKRETLERFIVYFKNIIRSIVENRNRRISDLEILTEEERRRILFYFNDTEAEYPKYKTIHRLFAEQVERTPDHIALVGAAPAVPSTPRGCPGQHQMTYRELNERSGRLAYLLIKKGILADSIVGIMAERVVEMIVGILGILKSGGAYLPIDPEYPQERIDYMLNDSKAKMLVTTRNKEGEKVRRWEGKKDIEVFCLNSHISSPHLTSYLPNFITSNTPNLLTSQPPNFPLLPASGNRQPATSLAYIIYTSGSTGKPKGVMVEHCSLVNLCCWHNTFYYVTSRDRATKYAGFGFDASVWEIFPYLLIGASIYIAPEEMILDIEALNCYCEDNGITISFLPTQMCEQFLGLNNTSLRVLLTGGDKLKNYIKKNYRLYNNYGPTENTVVTTSFCVTEESGNIPIGKPVFNNRIYIMDRNHHLQPIGVPGELYVGGESLARGYLNNPELTAEKFIMPSSTKNPFEKGFLDFPKLLFNKHLTLTTHYSPITLYKTGDLARWLPDGNIEFLGRIDHQVKLRGYRIELGEIEDRLLKYEGIKEAVVVLHEEERGDKYLCAYVVSAREYGISELREYLSMGLPDYMIPSYFVRLEKIPLTPNGKIDRRALPKPELKVDENYTVPRNKIEKKLAGIWCDILNRDALNNPIGISANFFHLGGHSLKAIAMINKIHKTFGVTIALQDVFRYPTIADISRIIKNSKVTGFEEIAKQEERAYYEMSYSQKRLWYINKRDPHNTAFNMPARITLHETVDEKIIRKVLEQLIERHESFRTSFKEVDREPVQVVEHINRMILNFKTLDRTGLDEAGRKTEYERQMMEESSYIFNLEEAPLFKAKLTKYKEEEYDLVFNMHHIISDGWTIEILKEEFNTLYNANKRGVVCNLEPLKIQYKDYAAWHNRLLADEEKVGKANDFWENHLTGVLPVLKLPYDFPHASFADHESAAYRTVIPVELVERLRAMAKEYQVSLFMVLLAAFHLLLSRVTGQEDIITAFPAAARRHESSRNIAGMFVNTLIVRSRVFKGEPFTDFFKCFQADMFNVLEFQDFPLELICSRLKIKYPEVSVFFNMINIGAAHLENLTNLENYHSEKVQDAKFDIVCYLTEYKNGVEINCNYFKHRFKPVTVETLMDMYMTILTDIFNEPGKKKKLQRKK